MEDRTARNKRNVMHGDVLRIVPETSASANTMF